MIKGMLNAVRQLTNNIRPTIVPIRDKEGKSITSIEGKTHRRKEYLEEILNISTTSMERNELASILTELPISINLLRREKLLMP